jgi:hypothetical protein
MRDSTAIHHDCRGDKEANKRREANLPGHIDIHGVLLVRLSMALIMPGDRYIACDLRHSEY